MKKRNIDSCLSGTKAVCPWWCALFIPALFCVMVSVGQAQTVTNTTSNVSYSTIQAAIDAAVADDQLNLSAGLHLTDSTLTVDKKLHFKGAGKNLTIVKREGAPAGPEDICVLVNPMPTHDGKIPAAGGIPLTSGTSFEDLTLAGWEDAGGGNGYLLWAGIQQLHLNQVKLASNDNRGTMYNDIGDDLLVENCDFTGTTHRWVYRGGGRRLSFLNNTFDVSIPTLGGVLRFEYGRRTSALIKGNSFKHAVIGEAFSSVAGAHRTIWNSNHLEPEPLGTFEGLQIEDNSFEFVGADLVNTAGEFPDPTAIHNQKASTSLDLSAGVAGHITGNSFVGYDYQGTTVAASHVVATHGDTTVINNSFSPRQKSVALLTGAVAPAVDATYNFWGSNAGALTADVTGNAITVPYFMDSDRLLAAPVHVGSQSTVAYSTISAAVAAAPAGDTVVVGPGTFVENVVTTVPLTIQGSGPDTIIAPISGVGVNLASGTSTMARSVLRDLKITGNGSVTGIIAGSFTTLERVVSSGHTSYGISLNPGTDLIIAEGHFDFNTNGLKLGSTASFTGIVITDSSFDDNSVHGWYSDTDKTAKPVLDNIRISRTTFNRNGLKGFYTERLSNATFDEIEVAGNANSPNLPNNAFGAGMDINLKWRSDYTSITIRNSTFTNNANGSVNGAALTIKARDDGSYSPPAATLDGVLVTGTTFDGNKRHFVTGEPGKNNAGPTGVIIEQSTFGASTNGSVVNHSQAIVTADSNYWGSPTGPGTGISGNVSAPIYFTDAGLTMTYAPVQNTTASTYFGTLGAAVAAASPGDVIELMSGVHTGPEVVIGKALTIRGVNAGLAGTNSARAAESQIFNMKLNITAPGVVIDGVEIYQTNNTADAIIVGAAATIRNSVLRRFGVSTGTIARAITTAVGVSGYLIENNLFTGDPSGSVFSGHKTWQAGIYLNGGSGTISGNTFEICRAAINADDFNAGITITGNTFRASGTYISFGGVTPTAGSFTIGGNEFAFDFNTPANNATLFNNSNVAPTFKLDTSGNTYGGIATADLTMEQKFALEARTYHRGRGGRNGAVELILNEQIVVPGSSIQQAINGASDGDTIHVAAGTYAENLVVGHPVILRGPNGGINPNTTARLPEAIIVPGISSVTDTNIIEIESADVTIDGFLLDGDNPALTSGFLGTNGADLDAACGVYHYHAGINNLVVTNNVIQNLSYFGLHIYGVPGNPATSGSVVSKNLMRNFGTYDTASTISKWGGGVLLYNNQYARITDNVMNNVRLGVQTGNYSDANPGTADSQVIAGNAIQTRRVGIFHNLHYGAASPFSLTGNQISGLTHSDEIMVRGIQLSSLAVASLVADNTIDFSSVTLPTSGYEVWNVQASSPAAISGGSVTGATIGLFLNSFEGYNSNAPDGSHATVSGLAIFPRVGGTGIRVLDSPGSTSHASVGLTLGAGVTVTNGAIGLAVENASASVVAISDLALSGQTGNYIELIANNRPINATAVKFAGKTGAEMTTGELLAVENKMLHQADNAALGKVTILPGFDANHITINDPQTALDFHIPSGVAVHITETGSLTVTGQFTLADGATLSVTGGALTFPDGTVFAGEFTFFNSFGSVNFDGDVTIAGSADGLILVSDVHVANGMTVTVDGTFTIDGCTVDSDGTFNLQVNAGSHFTMARTFFQDGTITVNSGSTEIYDNRFADSTIAVEAVSTGARVFHNLIDNTTNLTDLGAGTVQTVDGWGNVTGASFTRNNLPLAFELTPALLAGKRRIDANGVAYVQSADAVSATFAVNKLQERIIGVELLLGYNKDLLIASSLGLGTNWDDLTPFTEHNSSNVIGKFNAAIALDFNFPHPSGTDTDQTVGDLQLIAGATEGVSQVFHRVKAASDNVPATRLSKGHPGVGYLTPFTSNTPQIVIDNTIPSIAPGYTITQAGLDMTQHITLQGTLEISASVFDGLAGLDDADVVVKLEGATNTYVATQKTVTPGPTLGGDAHTTYRFEYPVTSATVNGLYDVRLTVTDRSGNTTGATKLGDITINKNELTATVQLEGLASGAVTRDVIFAFTDNNVLLETRTKSVTFTNGVGPVSFTDVNGETDQISARTGTHLRKRLPVVFTNGESSVDYTGVNKLRGGDLNADNAINLLDYGLVKFYWLNVVATVPAAAAADVNGDGAVNITDYQILQTNFYQQGDPQ